MIAEAFQLIILPLWNTDYLTGASYRSYSARDDPQKNLEMQGLLKLNLCPVVKWPDPCDLVSRVADSFQIEIYHWELVPSPNLNHC